MSRKFTFLSWLSSLIPILSGYGPPLEIFRLLGSGISRGKMNRISSRYREIERMVGSSVVAMGSEFLIRLQIEVHYFIS